MDRSLRIILAAATLLCATTASAADLQQVRVLVDVSGSMKRTDPQNLRVPAMRLLANLLPPDSVAGAWLFAGDVTPLMPVDEVDDAWQRRATERAARIHSRGQWTDIGAALDNALQGWDRPVGGQRRSMILLTDGKVDVAPDAERSAAARRRILDDILPRMVAANVRVHAIALSEDADAELLSVLAGATDGAFRVAEDAERLDRLFLELFEQAVQRDSLPLRGRRFEVDAAVEELTFLAFREKGSPPLRLVPPGGGEFSAEDHPAGVRWRSEAGYDLVTIASPRPGEWRYLGDEDPDNRALIVTDLKLETNPLPAHLLASEAAVLEARLTEQGATVDRTEFLELLDMTVTRRAPDGALAGSWPLRDDGLGDDRYAGDGLYHLELGSQASSGGQFEFVTTVNGETFQRQVRQPVKVVAEPLEVTAQPSTEAPEALLVRPAVPWLAPGSLNLSARVELPGGERTLDVLPEDGGWRIPVQGLPGGRDLPLTLSLSGQTRSGRTLEAQLPPRALRLPGPPPATEPATEQREPTDDGAASDSETAEEPGAGVNWLLVGSVVFLVNVALLGGGGLGLYWLIRGRPGHAQPTVSDETYSDDDADLAADAGDEQTAGVEAAA